MYLVTGISGFIGSHVARTILKEGNRVRGLIRRTSRLDLIADLDVELVYGDITRPGTLKDAVRGVEKVIHVAGLASDWGPFNDFYNINFLGTRNLALAASEEGIKRFVHIGTTAIFGFGFSSIDESYPMAEKLNAYGQTKKMAELWLLEFSRSTAMEITIIRPGNVFGPDDFTFMDKYLKALKSGRIAYVNKGRALTCPTFIENLVHGIWLASNAKEAVGEAFFITDGLDITWKEFTGKLADALHVKQPRFSIPFWLAYFMASIMEGVFKLLHKKNAPLITRYRVTNAGLNYHFSIEKARRLLKFVPSVDLDQAVRKTVDWYRSMLSEK